MSNGDNTSSVGDRPGNSPYAKDQVTLKVRGKEFQDWETVAVTLIWGASAADFRFTAAERYGGGEFSQSTINVGDEVQVNLGGVDVIDGYIETRQLAYDANRHAVELIGKSLTAPAARSSIKDHPTGSFDNMTFKDIATKILEKHKVQVKVIGQINQEKIDKVQVFPSENIWSFLDRLARPRGIILGADSKGNLLLIGKHQGQSSSGKLVEGQNIKKCQAVFTNKHVYEAYDTRVSCAASDDNAFKKASAIKSKRLTGTGPKNSYQGTSCEEPVKTPKEADDRNEFEKKMQEGTALQVTVVVQGWFAGGSSIWQPGENVFIQSPMCPLNSTLKIQSVTFTQNDRSGTESTIVLVKPSALNDTGFDTSAQ
jgi:prophage tail gpP-like protein